MNKTFFDNLKTDRILILTFSFVPTKSCLPKRLRSYKIKLLELMLIDKIKYYFHRLGMVALSD